MNIEKLKGKFIVLDGPDGAGKTTQLQLLEEFLISSGLVVQRAVDPGGTPTGQQIRNILLHSKELALEPMCETFLFMASRAQLIGEIILPALNAEKVVLADRFISSTLAYQGALGVDSKMILELGNTAVSGNWPAVTICLDVPVSTGMTRVGKNRDRMEARSEEYHNKVRSSFAKLGSPENPYPGKVMHIPADDSIENVHSHIVNALAEVLND